MRSGTWMLLLVVVALGLYIGLYERKQDTTDKRREIARRVLRIDPSRITGVRVVQSDLQFAVEKRGEQWRLASPVAARADGGEVSRIIDTFDLLEQSEVIRGRDQRKQGLTLADFGLDQPRARITLTSPEKEWVLLVGKDTPVGGNLFLKEANNSSVFVASTNLLADMPTSVDALRDRRLFQGFPGDVTRLDLRRREGLLNLVRAESGAWKMQQPWSGRAAVGSVQNLLDQLFTARIEDFVAESFDAASLYGLDEPAAQVSVIGDRRHGEQVVLVGKPVDRNTNQVYATISGEGTVFTVNRSLLDALTVKADTLRDRRLLTMPVADINYIRIEEDERAILLSRTETSGWEMLEPIRYRADEQRVQAALAEWTGARIETFMDPASTNWAVWGLEPPARRITFARALPAASTNHAATIRTPGTDDEVSVLVSSLAATNNLAVVKLAHEEALFQIQADLPDALPAAALWYRHPEVLTIDPAAVRSLTITRKSVEESVARDTATNEFRAAAATNLVDSAVAQQTVETICALQAVSFVADTVADLKPFGLAEPSAQLTVGIQGGTTPTRTLLLGDENAEGNTYAMLRGGDVVFTLASGTRDKLLASLYKSTKTSKDTQVVTPITLPSEVTVP